MDFFSYVFISEPHLIFTEAIGYTQSSFINEETGLEEKK
jgi:hypothetical protein